MAVPNGSGPADSSDLLTPARRFWDQASETYERDFSSTLVGRTRREAVWRDLDRLFRPGQRILELSCGSGVDADHLASRGVSVVACDLSPGMIGRAASLLRGKPYASLVDLRVLANEEIDALRADGPFDGAFSNFAGFNCVENLGSLAANLAGLLKPGAPLLTSMIGRVVPWEILWRLLHAEPGRAFERLGGSVRRTVEGGELVVRYPSVGEIQAAFAPAFRLRKWRGVGILVPPSYMNHWAERFPAATLRLAKADDLIGRWPGARLLADCVVLELERTK